MAGGSNGDEGEELSLMKPNRRLSMEEIDFLLSPDNRPFMTNNEYLDPDDPDNAHIRDMILEDRDPASREPIIAFWARITREFMEWGYVEIDPDWQARRNESFATLVELDEMERKYSHIFTMLDDEEFLLEYDYTDTDGDGSGGQFDNAAEVEEDDEGDHEEEYDYSYNNGDVSGGQFDNATEVEEDDEKDDGEYVLRWNLAHLKSN